MTRSPQRLAASFALAAVLSVATVGAWAQSPGQKPAAAPAAAPIWSVDKAASRLTFRVTAGDKSYDGVFKTWDAQIAFDPHNLKASRAMVSIAMASAMTGDPVRDQQLPKGGGFDVTRFPKGSFESTTIVSTGPDRYLATGDLSLHGMKRRIDLPFTAHIAKDVARMDGSVTLRSADFGLNGPDVGGAEVTVKVKFTARKAH